MDDDPRRHEWDHATRRVPVVSVVALRALLDRWGGAPQVGTVWLNPAVLVELAALCDAAERDP